jgi:hypothetical protein
MTADGIVRIDLKRLDVTEPAALPGGEPVLAG